MARVRKVELLPAELRQWLEDECRKRGFGDFDGITALLNETLTKGDYELRIGRSAVGDESRRLKRAQEAIAATTRTAEAIARAAPDLADNRSAGIMALVQSEMFQVMYDLRECEDLEDPVERLAVLDKAALAISRLSRGRVNQARWFAENEQRAKAAADAVEKITKRGGLTPEQSAAIRAQILGIAKTPTDKPPEN